MSAIVPAFASSSLPAIVRGVVAILAALLFPALCATLLSSGSALAADTPMPAYQPAARPDRMALAREAIKARDWKKSISELSQAVKEQPANADAHNLLAYSLRKQATPDLAAAFEHYKMALKINPNHRGAHEYIGEAYLMDNKPAMAEEHLALLKTICGNTSCEEYEDLARSIAQYKEKNK